MRYQRLILQSGSIAFTLTLHPRLTVISGLGRHERDSLVGELLGGLSGARRGSTVELVDDTGRRLSVRRDDRPDLDAVWDLDTGGDVTGDFLADGRVDVLAAMGLDLASARRRSRLASTDVAAASRSDALVQLLAYLDQDELWDTFDRVRDADARLRHEAELIGASAEDAPIIEEVEERHSRFEAALARHEWVRHHGIFVGGATTLASAPAAFLLHNDIAAGGFLSVAALTTFTSILFRRHMEKARALEGESLRKAGADSYIGFHIQRVNAMLDGQANRARLSQVAAEHREAVNAWRDLVGDVAVEWAESVRETVLTTAHRVQVEGRMRSTGGSGRGAKDPDLHSVEPAELAQSLVVRLADLRHAGRGGESLPLILDEPFAGVDPSVKQWLLELVGRSAGAPQVVYLTNDPEVAEWARLEAMAGHLDVVEPVVEPVRLT